MSKFETQTFDASEAKNKFGALIDAAQRRPVTIKRRGRAVAFVISPAEMEAIEDLYLGARATEIVRKGKANSSKKSRGTIDDFLRNTFKTKDANLSRHIDTIAYGGSR